jgi:hypothetical protein
MLQRPALPRRPSVLHRLVCTTPLGDILKHRFRLATLGNDHRLTPSGLICVE